MSTRKYFLFSFSMFGDTIYIHLIPVFNIWARDVNKLRYCFDVVTLFMTSINHHFNLLTLSISQVVLQDIRESI